MPARVCTVPLPPFSALHDRFQPGDFLDCYGVTSDMSPRDGAEIITRFPGWAQLLVRLRSLLVAPFGLRTSGPAADDKLGPFPVTQESETELIAGFNDKHLDFRVSVTAMDGLVTLATWVRPHNPGGRVYLAAIMPFHILIARNALARVAQAHPPSSQQPQSAFSSRHASS